jgi:peptidoglycan/LPS O-acetylase OafA/YrhL
MWAIFAVGAILRLATEEGMSLRADVAVVLISIHLLLVAIVPDQVWTFGWVFIPYVVLAIGSASTPGAGKACALGDFSYGLYLWGYPVQQAVIGLAGVHSTAVNLAMVLPLTLFMAFLSWHLVEEPALRLKSRFGTSRRASVTSESARTMA